MKKYCKLVQVTKENNNKFYEMSSDGHIITIKYGRIGSTSTTITKPDSYWNSVYNEKLKKGYTDVTPKHEDFVTTGPKDRCEEFVDHFRKVLKQGLRNIFLNENVSAAVVKEYQEIIDNLKNKNGDPNDNLLRLYTIAPRFMRDVKYHLVPHIKLEKIIESEQEILDSLASNLNAVQGDYTIAGVQITEEITSEYSYILDQLSGYKYSVLKINKPFENERFTNFVSNQTDKTTRFLIHGTKEFSVIPIIENGLMIRPTGNFSFSGKAYGNGNYFSEITSKSLNYTNGSKRVLFVYEVHVGNPFVYNGWYNGNPFPLEEKELLKRGFHSTYVKAGGGLLNSEIIVYNEHQSRIHSVIII